MSDPHSSHGRSNLIRELAYQENAAFVANLDRISMDELRRAFAPMFDRAAHAVEAAGYAQDDSVVVRLIRCRHQSGSERCGVSGDEWTAEADSLSDQERLISRIRLAAREAGIEAQAEGDIIISGLRVEAFIERWEG